MYRCTNTTYGASILGAVLCAVMHCNHAVAQGKDLNTEKNAPSNADIILEETVVLGDRKGNFTIITENAQKLVDVPGALGDPLSAVLSLPGVVTSNGRGGNEPAVRGSSPADNVYLVDSLPAGYIFHGFGSSIFSEYILQDFQLYSAGFGPEFIGATGAAFDIRLRQPKNQDLSGVVDVSLLRSGIFLESGITEKTAFYASARKSMIHLVVKEQDKKDTQDNDDSGIRIIEAPQDEDYQVKYAWQINDQNLLTISANGATDYVEAELTREADFVASNPDYAGDALIEQIYNGQNLHYQYTGKKLKNAQLSVGRTDFDNNTEWGNDYHSRVNLERTLINGQASFEVNKNHTITTGVQSVSNQNGLDYDAIYLVCNEFEPDCSVARRERINDKTQLSITEKAQFTNDHWRLTDHLHIDVGYQLYSNNFTHENLWLPRAGIGYLATPTIELSARYGYYARLPEIESSFIANLRDERLSTAKSKHSVLGIKQDLNNSWSWNLEVYAKSLEDLTIALAKNNVADDRLFTNGMTGKANGIDLLINKDLTDRWYGWLSLSYSNSERTNSFTQITKDYYLDTPWLLNWVMNYQFKPNMDIGWRLNLHSGMPYTPIIGLQDNPEFENSILPIYGDPFSERLPAYARLDLRYKWDFKIRHLDSALIVDIINVLNTNNIENRSLDYRKVKTINDPIITRDSAGLGILPTIGWRLYF